MSSYRPNNFIYIIHIIIIDTWKTKKYGFTKKLQWFAKANLLLVDEVGYEPVNAEETYVLFQLINVRYENESMIMKSNKTFGRWTEFMNNDEAFATASLDRLLHHCHIVSLQADSYRLKDCMKV